VDSKEVLPEKIPTNSEKENINTIQNIETKKKESIL
jgi:hypothetical protein